MTVSFCIDDRYCRMSVTPYLKRDRDRHGNARVFVRRNGRSIRLRAPEGSAAFAREYAAALAGLESRPTLKTAPAVKAPERGTLGWLAAAYFASREFKVLDAVSQRRRRAIIESCLAERHRDGPMLDCPLEMVTPAKVKALRDAKAGQGAANNRLKYLSALFGWAVECGAMPHNPAREVRRLRYATDGFHAWSVDEVRQFEARHPIGTKPRLALALLLFLGVRRGDVVTLGRQHVRSGAISFVPRKTRHRRKTLSTKPILSELARIIDASPTGALTFLETSFGKPFTAAGFGNWFRAACDQAELKHCSAHGLRKAAATLAAESGATTMQLQALFDWNSPAQAEVYTRGADRARLAAAAGEFLASGKRKS